MKTNNAEPFTAISQDQPSINRRQFLAGTSASLFAATVITPALVFGAEVNSKIKIGLAGCGGRGKWIAKLFQDHGGYHVAAVADYFQDRVNEAGASLGVPEGRRYTGLNGYKRMLDEPIDALVIETPPYFHPSQAADAVSAGKHVYMAKPIAVDVPGCVSVEKSSKAAADRNLCFLVDFQTRANKAYQEAVRTVHAGELGKIVSVQAEYHCPLYFEQLDGDLRKDPKSPELRLRAWPIDRVLSGDVITEQNIHSLDVASWVLNAEPVSAYGTGSRARDFIGDCWDRFAVIYHYPNDLFVSFTSHQVGYGCDDILCRVHCAEGTVDTHYAGPVKVHGKEIRTDATSGALYKEGAVANIASFHQSITSRDYRNVTVAPSVRSNLVTILGRTAAYEKRVVTWKEIMSRNERLTPDLEGLKT
jgi:myo-inositol 2-dehydrogenase / D-chiro-inositol 1-dehydrogenase